MSWPTTPARFILTEVDERGLRPGEDGELLSVSEYRGVVPRSTSASQQAASEDTSHYKRCEPGQLVLNRLWAFRGGLGVSSLTGLVSPDYAVFDIDPSMDPRFVHYQTRSAWFVAEMTKRLRGIGSPDASNGRAPRINTDDLGRIAMFTPPIDVQRAVVEVLDRELDTVNGIVAKNRQLVDAVGLRLSRLLADSLAGMPQASLQYFSAINMGQSPPSAEVVPTAEHPEGRPFVQGNAEFGQMVPAPTLVCDTAAKVASAGDILLSVRAPVGAMNIADGELGIGRGLCAITPDIRRLDPAFAWWSIREARPRLAAVATGSTYDAVSADDVAQLRIAVPDLSTQRHVAARLEDARRRAADLISGLNQQIALMETRRSSLLTAAATGYLGA